MSKCTICGATAKLMYRHAEVDVFRCVSCDHCFSEILPEVGEELYEPDYFEKHHKNWFDNPDFELFNLIIDEIVAIKPNALVIDVGCGRGSFLRHAAKRSSTLKLSGIDLVDNRGRDGSRIDYMVGDVFKEKINKKFNVVVSMAVIEHVKDPHEFLDRLCCLCLPSSILVLHTVNDRSVLYGIARMLYSVGFKMPLNRLYRRHHLNHYTDNSMQKLMTLHGLEILRVIKRNMPMAAVDLPPSSAVMRLLLRFGIWCTFILGTLCGRTFSQTVIVRVP